MVLTQREASAIAGLPRPERSYLICATPRSGSTLLCQALAATGLAGRPQEYFEARRETGVPRSPRGYFRGFLRLDELPLPNGGAPAPDYSSLRAVGDYREHLAAALSKGTGPNGIFGAKLMWMHVEDFVPLTRTLPELDRAGLGESVAALFPRVDYVWIRRGDRVRQAVSLWRALQTQAWRSDAGCAEARPAEYHFGAISHLSSRIRAEDEAWESWFREEGLAPLELLYEDIAADLPSAVGAVLAHLGADANDGERAFSPMRRQSDELSEQWVERYRRELAERRRADGIRW
jgi:trehalose 2-sulfotransferase